MKKLDKQADIFKALSDKSRLRILKMLQDKTLCVCEIRAILKLVQAHHQQLLERWNEFHAGE